MLKRITCYKRKNENTKNLTQKKFQKLQYNEGEILLKIPQRLFRLAFISVTQSTKYAM